MEIKHLTNLKVQVGDRKSVGFIEISKDDLPYWPLSHSTVSLHNPVFQLVGSDGNQVETSKDLPKAIC